MGGMAVSRLVLWTRAPEQAVRVRALAGEIVLYSWASFLTLTMPLSNKVYKRVPTKLIVGVALQ